MNDTNTDGTERSATKKMKPTIVKKWDLKDRSDGVEIRTRYNDGRTEKENWSDEDARELAETILETLESDDRPVTEGEHVR